MWNKVLLQLCVCACSILLINSQSCVESSPPYLYNSITLTCENNTRTLPTPKKSVQNIKCLDCNIPILDENTIITNFRGEVFNLSSSHIQKIKENVFKTFTNSTHRFLFDNNEINYIAPKVFSNFSLTEEIALRNNKISFLEARTFQGTNMSQLDLSQNHLTNISLIFNGMRVTKLNLSSNGIKEIDENAFDEVIFWTGRQWRSAIQQLDLSNNFITKLIPNTFKSPNKDNLIRNLYLQKNVLSSIDNNTFSQLSYLRYLSLEENRISELYKDSLKGLTSLNTLILSNNLLTNIPNGMFSDLRSLELLDLSHNQMASLSSNTFSGLTGLTKLNMSHNDLKVLEESQLFPLGKLISLDISNTKLREFKLQTILDHHFRLRVLVINDNFWTCKDLVHMYKQMNHRGGGFDYPSRHFDVPNLHGIACTREELESYDNLSFEDFMNIISQDRVFEDIFDSRLNNDHELNVNEINTVIKNISKMTVMFIIITIITFILFIQCVVKYVFLYLHSRNIVQKDKFCFVYAQNQDNVELLH